MLGGIVGCWASASSAGVVLNVIQRVALLSFTYKNGPHWFSCRGFSTITRRLRHHVLAPAPAVLMLYLNRDGPNEAGLRRRRKAETAPWNAAARGRAASGSGGYAKPLAGVPRFRQRNSAPETSRGSEPAALY
jgi:hypothetical protein